MHDPQATLDTSGLICPEPIMLLHRQVRKLESGETVLLIATDPSTARDVPKFCMHLGHELVEQRSQQTPAGEVFEYLIQKA